MVNEKAELFLFIEQNIKVCASKMCTAMNNLKELHEGRNTEKQPACWDFNSEIFLIHIDKHQSKAFSVSLGIP